MRALWLAASFLLSAVAAQTDPFEKHTISAPGINASLIAYGATLTNLYVNDKAGNPRDIVVGYDDGRQYYQDSQTNHTYFGAVVGRYANRIKNGTFSVGGVSSHVPENEHMGHNTLHGGKVGYDQRNWTLVAANESSVTFSFLDQALEGFPGSVHTLATYAVAANRFSVSLVSVALDAPTPINLAAHIYWNLDAFETPDTRRQVLHLPYSPRLIATDNIQVPTGALEAVAGGPFDFTAPKPIGQDLAQAKKCGFNCTGYDNAFIVDRPRYAGPEATDLTLLSLSSPDSGIRMDVKTNQQSLQYYSCLGQNGTIPVKKSQQYGNATRMIDKFACTVFETQQWIDGINHPEWGQSEYQIYSPSTGPAVNWAQYDFSVDS